MVEHWRQVARAAALGEHDFDAGLRRDSLDARQTHTLIGDIAATVRALVVLDQRYSNIPGWEKLHRGERLGWAALACALDASLEPPDYAIDDARLAPQGQGHHRPRQTRPARGAPSRAQPRHPDEVLPQRDEPAARGRLGTPPSIIVGT